MFQGRGSLANFVGRPRGRNRGSKRGRGKPENNWKRGKPWKKPQKENFNQGRKIGANSGKLIGWPFGSGGGTLILTNSPRGIFWKRFWPRGRVWRIYKPGFCFHFFLNIPPVNLIFFHFSMNHTEIIFMQFTLPHFVI